MRHHPQQHAHSYSTSDGCGLPERRACAPPAALAPAWDWPWPKGPWLCPCLPLLGAALPLRCLYRSLALWKMRVHQPLNVRGNFAGLGARGLRGGLLEIAASSPASDAPPAALFGALRRAYPPLRDLLRPLFVSIGVAQHGKTRPNGVVNKLTSGRSRKVKNTAMMNGSSTSFKITCM